MIPWSYSFLSDLKNCPHKAFRKFVRRDLPKETSPALDEGHRVHELFEHHINSKGRWPLPAEFQAYASPLITAGDVRAEVKLGMTRDMLGADFFGEPWGRGKLDVLRLDPPIAFVADWKTGKMREDDHELRIQALLVRSNYPQVDHVYGCYVWLKDGRIGKVHDLSDVNRTYHGVVQSMDEAQKYEDAGRWPKYQNPLCGWCPVKDCEHNRNPN